MAEATMTVEPELMTQSAYAMLRGISKQAINKHVQSGLIVLESGKVNRSQADAAMAQLDPGRSKAAANLDADDHAPFEPPPVTEPGKVRQLSAFQDARAAREVAEAKRAEFELDKLIGTVVDRAGVKRAGVNCGRALRDSLMGSAVRIGPGLVGITEPGEMVRRLEGE
ncbi:MAG TPA: hypothetical protein VIR56_06795 [Solimonas sp.]